MPLVHSGTLLCALNSLLVENGEGESIIYASERMWDGRHESAHTSHMAFLPNAHHMCVSIH